MAEFTVVGEALVDLVSTGPTSYAAHPGGSLYNVALTLARLDEQVSLVARTGSDVFGRMLEDKARASGVRFDCWQRGPEPTSLAVASVDAQGVANYDFYLDSTAGLGWGDSLVDLALPDDGVLHLGSLASWRPPSSAVLQALQRRAYDSGRTLVCYDPNVRPVLIADVPAARASVERCVAATHVVKASDEDVAFLYPGTALDEVAAQWCALGALLVVVTRGIDGAVAWTADGELIGRPAVPVDVVDTVGAGDSFAGGLLSGLAAAGATNPDALRSALTDDVIGPALEQAVLVAAMTCERPGAEPPTRAELDARRP